MTVSALLPRMLAYVAGAGGGAVHLISKIHVHHLLHSCIQEGLSALVGLAVTAQTGTPITLGSALGHGLGLRRSSHPSTTSL